MEKGGIEMHVLYIWNQQVKPPLCVPGIFRLTRNGHFPVDPTGHPAMFAHCRPVRTTDNYCQSVSIILGEHTTLLAEHSSLL